MAFVTHYKLWVAERKLFDLVLVRYDFNSESLPSETN